jgi:hypothetical protein
VKQPGEVALVTETRTKANFDERQFAFGQQRLGAINAEFDQILVRRRSG